MASPRHSEVDLRHEVRRRALQALYQLDAGGTGAPDEVHRALLLACEPDDAAETAASEQIRAEAIELARGAWTRREEADSAVADLAPQWPTYRQPVVDRCILRMAWFEMISHRTPPKVVINESVELAREFSTDKSPLFINGVLDRLMRRLRAPQQPERPEQPTVEVVMGRPEPAEPGA
jgi:N utilization substance protein B